MAEYRLMYLKQLKLVTSAALPSLNNKLVRHREHRNKWPLTE